ncbi:MAG: AMP-binding protein [Ktedonobacteraceae bacterium]
MTESIEGSSLWTPSKEFIEKTKVRHFLDERGIKSYEELVRKSTSDISWWWSVCEKEIGLEWFRPYSKTVDTSKGSERASWFPDGLINLTHNALDKIARSIGGSSTAFVWEGEDGSKRTYTYCELARETNMLSNYLKGIGIKKGDVVASCIPMFPETIVGMFATLKIGAVFSPIFCGYGPSAVANRLVDAKPKLLITCDGYLRKGKKIDLKPAIDEALQISKLSLKTLVVERLGSEVPMTERREDPYKKIMSESSKNCEPEYTVPDDPALLLYTSGTTGKPKGAMLTHSNLLAAVDMSHKVLSISNYDKFIVIIPMCHIYGLTVVMLGLLSKGGTLVVLEKFDPASALKLIESQRVTLLPAVPAIYQFFLMELEKNDYDLSSLRACLSGAASMPVEMFPRLVAKFPGAFIEGYGLTETSSVVAINPVDGVKKRGSVGVPLGAIDVAIVGPDGKRLPHTSAHVGEIAVKGANVMRGYFGKPDATAECLKDGWFFTGDLGYRDEEGYLFIAGRTKELIIRGGQNIYPREIEDVIMRLAEVAEVAVVGVLDQYMGERVKAVIALKPGKSLGEETVKAFCAENLAEYKVPRLVEFVQALPRNSTGKVLKRLLQT